MTSDAPTPKNRSAQEDPAQALFPKYPEPVLGNPVSTLMESGVGNCFPGLEFDLRQLDVRFFPGLVFEFPGVTPAGPDGTQGAKLIYADTGGDALFDLDLDWVQALKRELDGVKGGALGDGTWYLHWLEQDGRRIEMYDFTLYQNALTPIPYEGETVWWLIRSITLDPDPETADLTIALTQRDAIGAPSGQPVVLTGKRRAFLDGEGVIPLVYHAGELTSSMCSPWTHDFRDCACQYWASNHPDVALGPVDGPSLEDGTAMDDPRQSLNFVDWMRRRHDPSRDLSAATTISGARPGRYDPYEINLRWEELDFVIGGEERTETPGPVLRNFETPFESVDQVIEELTKELAPLEFTLSMEYLYSYFSLKQPEEITPETSAIWPDLADDVRAARQFILSVALSEMTHMRWDNQLLWMLERSGHYPPGKSYAPVVEPSDRVPVPALALGKLDAKDSSEATFKLPDERSSGASDGSPDEFEHTRKPMLQRATPEAIDTYVDVERPGGDLDSEYAGIVSFLRARVHELPPGLYELAVRIDSDGVQHYQKFRDVKAILEPYRADPSLYLREMSVAEVEDPDLFTAIQALRDIVKTLKQGYAAEAADDMKTAERDILAAREHMHIFRDQAEKLARAGKGIPIFKVFGIEADHA
ncbi:ferritin-like domain-containing protein [Litorisediminicola beolgyonensis]|uniref:Ferritin-like domain-containing protein n=1 Tax=Litorisediminicola beolgyonensis TaxID=1173614 RepID=A0ABW3ZH13_9RHOB